MIPVDVKGNDGFCARVVGEKGDKVFVESSIMELFCCKLSLLIEGVDRFSSSDIDVGDCG